MLIRAGRIGEAGALDITIKSASEFMGQQLAPTWELVGGHKHYTGQRGWCERYPPLNDQEYSKRYLALLRQRYTQNKAQWQAFLRAHEHGEVILACYCADGFCHRHIAVEALQKLARSIGITAE